MRPPPNSAMIESEEVGWIKRGHREAVLVDEQILGLLKQLLASGEQGVASGASGADDLPFALVWLD